MGEAAEGRWGAVFNHLDLADIAITPPTDRFAITSPTGGGS